MNKVIGSLMTLVINAVLASPQNRFIEAYNESLTTMAANRTEDDSTYYIFKGKNRTVLLIFLVVWPVFLISIGLFYFIFRNAGQSTIRVGKCELIIFLFSFLNIGFLVTLFVPQKSFLGMQDVIFNGLTGAVISAVLFNVNAFIYARLKIAGAAWKTIGANLLMLNTIVVSFVCGGVAYWKGKDLNPNQALNYLWAILIVGVVITVSSCPLFFANWSNAEEDRKGDEDSEKSGSVQSRASKSIGYLNTPSQASTISYAPKSAISQYSTQQSTYSGLVAKLLPNYTRSTFAGYGGQRDQRPVTEVVKKERSQSSKGERKLSKEDKKRSKVSGKSPSGESTGTVFYREQVAKGKAEGKEITSFSVYGPRMFQK